MLFIAQAEQGPALLRREDVDLHAEASRIAEYLSLVADEKNVRVEAPDPGLRLRIACWCGAQSPTILSASSPGFILSTPRALV